MFLGCGTGFSAWKRNGLTQKNTPMEKKQTNTINIRSIFLAQNDTGKIVGTARAILPSELGLPVLNNFEDIVIPDDVEWYVELSRLIVAKETRGLTVTLGLLKSILDWCLDEDITTAFVIVEEKMLNFLLRLGYPFQKAGQGKILFWGLHHPGLCKVKRTQQGITTSRY